MKLNWGTGILVIIILFLLSVVAFFIYSTSLDINLVEENYYEKELVYQERIDRTRNAESLEEAVRIDFSDGMLRLDFPDFFIGKKTVGHVLFYRPSDPSLDISVPLQLNDTATQVIQAGYLVKGRYIIKIDWTTDHTGYYFEEEIIY